MLFKVPILNFRNNCREFLLKNVELYLNSLIFLILQGLKRGSLKTFAEETMRCFQGLHKGQEEDFYQLFFFTDPIKLSKHLSGIIFGDKTFF